ncbi:MAG: transketolase [Candidatus Omnitrophota bacterium]
MTPVCAEIRKRMIDISMVSGHGHLPSCFSVIEILYAVYSVIKHDPKNPLWEERDIFILSKGHAALAQYCVLAEFGYFNKKDLAAYGAFMSNFGCHADRSKIPGVEASTGSLGHGIGIAVGMALANKIKKHKRRILTLIGDGEANEGTVWEAMMVAENLKLSNLTVIYDNNLSHARGLQIRNPAERFRAFGCQVSEVSGHDIAELKKKITESADTVKVIVANTQKGYGCKTLVDNQYEWHRKSPNAEQKNKLIEEICAETI